MNSENLSGASLATIFLSAGIACWLLTGSWVIGLIVTFIVACFTMWDENGWATNPCVLRAQIEIAPYVKWRDSRPDGDGHAFEPLLIAFGLHVSQSLAFLLAEGQSYLNQVVVSEVDPVAMEGAAASLTYGAIPCLIVSIFFFAFCAFVFVVPENRDEETREFEKRHFDYATRALALKLFACGILVSVYVVCVSFNPELNGMVANASSITGSSTSTRVDEQNNPTTNYQEVYYFEYEGTGKNLAYSVKLVPPLANSFRLSDAGSAYVGSSSRVEELFEEAIDNYEAERKRLDNSEWSGIKVRDTPELKERKVERSVVASDKVHGSDGEVFYSLLETSSDSSEAIFSHDPTLSSCTYTFVASIVQREGSPKWPLDKDITAALEKCLLFTERSK